MNNSTGLFIDQFFHSDSTPKRIWDIFVVLLIDSLILEHPNPLTSKMKVIFVGALDYNWKPSKPSFSVS